MTRGSELLALEIPIIQAPMAGVSTPDLAAAVSNAGGLGSIAIGSSTVDAARIMIQKTKSLTSAAFNVNVFCHPSPRHNYELEARWIDSLKPFFQSLKSEAPSSLVEIYRSFLDDKDMLSMLLNVRPAFVSFHFGLPSNEIIQLLRQSGIKLIASATSLDEAKLCEASGVDAIVAQGIEAGGHRSQFDLNQPDEELETFKLLSRLTKSIGLPIIAAGGIMNGREIKKALDLGASAVQLGTAFLLCPESATSAAYRKALLSDVSTHMTSGISGRPARGLSNRLTAHALQMGRGSIPEYPIAYDAAKQLHALASKQGSSDFAAFWAGQGIKQLREMPAKDLVERLWSESKA